MNMLLRVILLFGAISASPAMAQEIRVDPNYIVSKLSDVEGWQLWKGETPGGTTCFASIQSPGAKDPMHLGYPGLMSADEPMLSMFPHSSIFLVSTHGRYSVVYDAQIKRVDDRFSTEVPNTARELAAYSAQKVVLDVHTGRHKYAGALNTKQQVKFDLGDIERVTDAIKSCSDPAAP